VSPLIVQSSYGDDDVAPVRDLLADHMWLRVWEVDRGQGLLRVSGILKPREATSAAGVRRGLLDVFDEALETLEHAGYRHREHPEFTISGQVLNDATDWSQKFVGIEGKVDLYLYARREDETERQVAS
jgi:hypothetical protein